MHGPLNVKLNQQIAPSENRTHYYIKFYSHQLMHFFIQLCISHLSYIKIT